MTQGDAATRRVRGFHCRAATGAHLLADIGNDDRKRQREKKLDRHVRMIGQVDLDRSDKCELPERCCNLIDGVDGIKERTPKACRHSV